MTIGEVAQVIYTERCIVLDDYARGVPDTMPLTKRYARNMAAVAYRAAKAEQEDPEPEVRMCRICRGVRTCDWAAHLVRITG